MTTSAPVSRQRWLIPVVVVVLSVTVGGGLLARELYQRQEPVATAENEPIVVSSSTTPLAPDEEPGSDRVLVTADVAIHPQGDAVRRTVQTFFSAINSRNYQLWRTVATAERQHSQPLKEWQDSFKSTKDGSILIYRIERGGGDSLRVLVGLTSTQNLTEAPKDFQEKCIRWRLVLPIETQGGLKIDLPVSNYPPEREKC